MYDPNEPRFLRARKVFVPVIHDLHVSVHKGEIVAIVGASGSGKTLLADAIMGIFAPNATVSGRIWFDGIEREAAALRALRGNGISLVPQSISYLDPLMRVGRQAQGFRHPTKVAQTPGRTGQTTQATQATQAAQTTQAAQARQRSIFERYDLPPTVASLYPHELSGGMARRVLLACALIDEPQLIIADEPTPGLDLNLARIALADFRAFANRGGGVLLITHDIELALSVADRVAVFNEGTVVEETAVANFASPQTLQHPFSQALWHALPEHDFIPMSQKASKGHQQGSNVILSDRLSEKPQTSFPGHSGLDPKLCEESQASSLCHCTPPNQGFGGDPATGLEQELCAKPQISFSGGSAYADG
jgi:peptide/nickel transport system ATP-binding protein